jgi:FHS family L-fucose permease-like MFS transporter
MATFAPTADRSLTEKRYVAPFILITSLFFLWAFGVNLNDILIPRFKNAFQLSDFQSSFIQVAFFSGYCLAALPAGRLMEKIGYKRGILTGLALCASGALLFVPASAAGTYAFFLVALFVMACGQSFLEVAANPYVTILGPPDTSERRLNLAQSFNAVGAVCAMLLGLFILSGKDYTAQQRAVLSTAQEQAYRTAQAGSVRLPYTLIACIFVVVAVLIVIMHLPEVSEKSTHPGMEETTSWKKVLQQGHLVRGVLAQFLYVGAQVGVGSFVIRFAQHSLPGLGARSAWYYLLGHWIGFMLGRFGGSALMKTVPAPRLLSIFGAGSLISIVVALSAGGSASVWALVLIGFFHSIMFPTIFALSIKNLGPLTKRGSSLQVMAILGGAVLPAIMGRISDATSIRTAFVVPLVCYIYVLYFAVAGYKPGMSGTKDMATVASVTQES